MSAIKELIITVLDEFYMNGMKPKDIAKKTGLSLVEVTSVLEEFGDEYADDSPQYS